MPGVLSQVGRLFAGVSFATSKTTCFFFLPLFGIALGFTSGKLIILIIIMIIIIEYENTRESSQGSYIEGLVLDNYRVSLKITSR